MVLLNIPIKNGRIDSITTSGLQEVSDAPTANAL
jgi:hypothetical protein